MSGSLQTLAQAQARIESLVSGGMDVTLNNPAPSSTKAAPKKVQASKSNGKSSATLYCTEDADGSSHLESSAGALQTPILSQSQQRELRMQHVALPDEPASKSDDKDVDASKDTPKAPPAKDTRECIIASSCPNTHPYRTCKQTSANNKLCKVLQMSKDGKRTTIGMPGRYMSVAQAFEANRDGIAPRAVVPGSSVRSSSMVVHTLPADSGFVIILVVKMLEGVALMYVAHRNPIPMVWRVIVAVYFLSMLHFHLKQAAVKRKRPKSDGFLEANGVREVESVQLLPGDRMLVFHDGGKTVEVELRLKSASGCQHAPHACVEYECCQTTEI